MTAGDQEAGSPQFELDFRSGHRLGQGPESDEFAPRIRVSPRARRLSVRVYQDARVEVVVPPRARPREVERFLGEHRQWIEARRAIALRAQPAPEPFPPAAVNLAATGETWRLHLAGGEGRLRLAATPAEGGGILTLSGQASPANLRAALRSWLMRAAQKRLAPRVVALAHAAGVQFSRVSVRRQRSRWGSCSVRGTISLNACLLFQRREVVDYLIVHELMHVRHMNHSDRFWRAVEGQCPGWREWDRELVGGWRHVPRWVFSES